MDKTLMKYRPPPHWIVRAAVLLSAHGFGCQSPHTDSFNPSPPAAPPPPPTPATNDSHRRCCKGARFRSGQPTLLTHGWGTCVAGALDLSSGLAGGLQLTAWAVPLGSRRWHVGGRLCSDRH